MMSGLLIVLAAVAVMWMLAYHRLPAIAWTLAAAAGLALISVFSGWPQPLLTLLWMIPYEGNRRREVLLRLGRGLCS